MTTVAVATGDTKTWMQCDTEPVWLGKDHFAMDRIDDALLHALRRNPQAQIILDLRVDPYKGWGTEHPEEIIRNAQGQRAYGPVSYVGKYTDDADSVDAPDSGRWWYPSRQSEIWRQDMQCVFARIAEHVQSSPYGKAVVGFFITGRDDGQFVVHDMGQYWNDPDIHREIGRVQKITQGLMQTRKSNFRPDVCVVVTEEDHPYLAQDEPVIPYDEVNFHPQWQALACSGVPFERHNLKDILTRTDLQDFRVYVFLHNAYLSQDDREAIREKLQNRDRTLVWVYGAGYISKAGKSVDGMSDLIGIQLATDETSVHHTMETALPAVQPFCGGAEMYFEIFNRGAPGVQSFWIEDPDAIAWATYVETNQVAMAAKDQAGWRSVYVGAAQGLACDVFHDICQQAGAYVAGPAGQQIHLNGEFASLHALRSGPYTLQLPPGRTRVLDADTGQVLSDQQPEYDFPVTAQTTYWFLLE